MADERPPIWVQLTTEYLVIGSSDSGSTGIDDDSQYLVTEKIT
ncbi:MULTISPECIES: hypothetical protein [Lactiplantibacillus]|nr:MULTISPECIES: hypothetical protein [Lactiplantibacillus]MDO7804475.1 hypothetical protein [Lactiplantibacillus pentosus]MDY1544817.1 hypothetical protein [Lactiplantibacillus pentosus]